MKFRVDFLVKGMVVASEIICTEMVPDAQGIPQLDERSQPFRAFPNYSYGTGIDVRVTRVQ